VVIEAFPLILKSFPDATLEIIGDGLLHQTLRAKVDRLGLRTQVRFHGRVSQSRVAQLLSESDIFCYPTSASEGFPKVVLEAMSAGLPVVTTKVSVLPELMKSGCGVLLDDRTAEALANAVVLICSDEARYTSMSRLAIESSKPYTLEAWKRSIGEILSTAWSRSTSMDQTELRADLQT
jgi:glycosyltransferase involved in cell wall biosynthesis